MRTSAIVAAGLAALALFTGTAAASDKNDTVLNESQFHEVFKQDSPKSKKNYAYTWSEFTDSIGRHCTVVTGAGETAVAVDCDPTGNG